MSRPPLLKSYCFTWNNPPSDSKSYFDAAYQDGRLKYAIAQPETGETGTPHLQGYMELVKQSRITSIKKWGSPWNVLHLEPRRGTQEQAIHYCMPDKAGQAEKHGTVAGPYWEIGVPQANGVKHAYQLAVILAKESMDVDQVAESYPEEFVKHSRGLRDLVQTLATKKARTAGYADAVVDFSGWENLYPYQRGILDLVAGYPDPRKILWLYDPDGNHGKSSFASYLQATKNAYVVDRTDSDRVLFAYNYQPIVVLDIPRGYDMKYFSYGLLEKFKDGKAFSTFLKPETKTFPKPHVIVLANHKPDVSKWTADRWMIRDWEWNEIDPQDCVIIQSGNRS